MNWNELLGEDWWWHAAILANKLAGQPSKPRTDVYPERLNVFAAFDEVEPNDVRVIILGQDPYHSVGKARGVAFGYHPGYTGSVNSSLANIILEAGGDPTHFDKTLRNWTQQGVLLLNTRLTVPHEQPMGHAGLGWEEMVSEALEVVVKRGQPPILAWGAEARKMAARTSAWTVIDTSHPCRYSASRGNKPFLGSNCFERVNEALVAQGDEPINWACSGPSGVGGINNT